MSEGCLLRAIVRGLMSDEFLQSSEFADALRPVYEAPPGKDAASAIAGIYGALSTQDAKDALAKAEQRLAEYDNGAEAAPVEAAASGGMSVEQACAFFAANPSIDASEKVSFLRIDEEHVVHGLAVPLADPNVGGEVRCALCWGSCPSWRGFAYDLPTGR